MELRSTHNYLTDIHTHNTKQSLSNMFYKLARLFFKLDKPKLKLTSLAVAHIARMRYIAIFIDPVKSCNLKCKMCYFSDDKKRPKPTTPIDINNIDKYKTLFKRAAKLQIGCGAEPTIYKHLAELIQKGKEYGIPYIEITTNGQLLNFDNLQKFIDAGLGGMTLSLHGTSRETYEYLMGNASFTKLTSLIKDIKRIKTIHPDFVLRINYTFNNLNIKELSNITQLFEGVKIDVLQIRPIQNMGDTEYSDFNLKDILLNFETLITPIELLCKERNIIYIGPNKENLLRVDKEQDVYSDTIENLTYCYISSDYCYQEDYDIDKDTFSSYHKRKRSLQNILKLLLSRKDKAIKSVETSKKMNYKIK